MNREDVAMDVTVQNVEILRERLEQAEDLLRDIVDALRLGRGFGWEDAAADRIVDFLASQQSEGFTHFPELLESVKQMDAMLKAEGAQGERERFEAELHILARRRNEHGDYVLPSIQDRWAGWQDRAALAPHSPAPELMPDDQRGDFRGWFEGWALENEHPVFGWLGADWLDQGDEPNTYGKDYIQGAWVMAMHLSGEFKRLKFLCHLHLSRAKVAEQERDAARAILAEAQALRAKVEEWAQRCAEAQVQRDAYQQERDEALRARVVVVPDSILPHRERSIVDPGFNEALRQVKRLNGKAVSEGLLRRMLRDWESNDTVALWGDMEELQELLGEGKEVGDE